MQNKIALCEGLSVRELRFLARKMGISNSGELGKKELLQAIKGILIDQIGGTYEESQCDDDHPELNNQEQREYLRKSKEIIEEAKRLIKEDITNHTNQFAKIMVLLAQARIDLVDKTKYTHTKTKKVWTFATCKEEDVSYPWITPFGTVRNQLLKRYRAPRQVQDYDLSYQMVDPVHDPIKMDALRDKIYSARLARFAALAYDSSVPGDLKIIQDPSYEQMEQALESYEQRMINKEPVRDRMEQSGLFGTLSEGQHIHAARGSEASNKGQEAKPVLDQISYRTLMKANNTWVRISEVIYYFDPKDPAKISNIVFKYADPKQLDLITRELLEKGYQKILDANSDDERIMYISDLYWLLSKIAIYIRGSAAITKWFNCAILNAFNVFNTPIPIKPAHKNLNLDYLAILTPSYIDFRPIYKKTYIYNT